VIRPTTVRPPTVPEPLALALARVHREADRLADPNLSWLNDPARPGGCACRICQPSAVVPGPHGGWQARCGSHWLGAVHQGSSGWANAARDRSSHEYDAHRLAPPAAKDTAA
jgi:hypothetical protein